MPNNDDEKEKEKVKELTVDDFKRLIIPRKGFTKENCLRFKEAIDNNIETRTNVFIPCRVLGIKASTMHNRINEALLYLIELADKEFPGSKYKSTDYIRYRSQIKFIPVVRGEDEGILIDWHAKVKVSQKRRRPSTQVRVSDLASEGDDNISGSNYIQRFSWKEQVIAFIEDETAQTISIEDPEDFGGLYLSDIDIEWLTNLFTKAGIEFSLGKQLIRAVK